MLVLLGVSVVMEQKRQ